MKVDTSILASPSWPLEGTQSHVQAHLLETPTVPIALGWFSRGFWVKGLLEVQPRDRLALLEWELAPIPYPSTSKAQRDRSGGQA